MDAGFSVLRRQQEPLCGEVLEQRRMHRYVRILPHAYLERVAFHARERGWRVGVALPIPLKVETRLHGPDGATIKREHVARNPVLAQLLSDRHRFLGGS